MPNREQRRAAEHRKHGHEPPQKSRLEDAPREETPGGQTAPDVGGAGAPTGGQVRGREGDQQGTKY
jgi:hypothetical protein